jgi:serine protease Do
MVMRTMVFMMVLAGSFLMVSATSIQAKTSQEGIRLLTELENVFAEIADEVKPAVVNISGISPHGKEGSSDSPQRRPPDSPGSGSGVIIDKRGYIVTNNHVVGGADEVEVRLSDKRRFVGKVVGKDPGTDLAVVKIEDDKGLPVVNWGNSDRARVGQWVIAVGNPFGLDRTVTVGVISGMGRENVQLSRYENFIQTDASINPGNSGGPLFNIKGEVIGINTAIINFAQGIGFAIPSTMAQGIVEQLITSGKVVRGWLGVGIQAVTDDLASKFGVHETRGVLVNEVFEGDPAHNAGLQPGDIIVMVDGKDVDTPQTLSRLVAGFGPGSKVNLIVLRDGKEKKYTIELGQRKEEAVVASIPPRPETVLGLTVQDLTDDLAERFNLKEKTGALVSKVEPGSISDSQGIKEGDLIREVNREKVTSQEDFRKNIEKVEKGESILVRIIRENRAFYVVLKTEKE